MNKWHKNQTIKSKWGISPSDTNSAACQLPYLSSFQTCASLEFYSASVPAICLCITIYDKYPLLLVRLVPGCYFWKYYPVCHSILLRYFASLYHPTPSTNWPSRENPLIFCLPNVACSWFKNLGGLQKREQNWKFPPHDLASQTQDTFPSI